MTNCLSSSKFANLLFVNVQIGNVRATALFDTGAGMTVIVQSLLHRLRAAPEKDVLRAGNNRNCSGLYADPHKNAPEQAVVKDTR